MTPMSLNGFFVEWRSASFSLCFFWCVKVVRQCWSAMCGGLANGAFQNTNCWAAKKHITTHLSALCIRHFEGGDSNVSGRLATVAAALHSSHAGYSCATRKKIVAGQVVSTKHRRGPKNRKAETKGSTQIRDEDDPVDTAKNLTTFVHGSARYDTLRPRPELTVLRPQANKSKPRVGYRKIKTG